MYYNYYEAMKANIKQYLEDEFERCYSDVDSLEELSEKLYDDLWTDDSITGNGSGSYTFNSLEAKEYVLDNMDLCKEALESFCTPAEELGNRFLNEDWEWLDVTIRCYILGSVISELLEDAEEDFEKWLEEKEAEDEE